MPSFGWFRRRQAPPLVLLSNREPYVHLRGDDGTIRIQEPVGGLVSALQPLMAATGGTWVAWGSGSADFEVLDPTLGVPVPPARPAYRLRRVQLSPREVQEYYIQSANRTLWPLCHSLVQYFAWDPEAWRTYRRVNQRFALVARLEAAGRPAIVWVHDYHLAYVAEVLRRAGPAFVHHFWHIPWPPPDLLRALPVAGRLVRALLANDLLVFQTSRDQANFLAGVADLVPDARIHAGRATVRWRGRATTVRAVPISIDVDAFERAAARADNAQLGRTLRRELLPRGGQLVLGVDRIDYTKGIPQRLEAFDRLLAEEPDLRGRVAFLQIAVPSRAEVPEYAGLEGALVKAARAINARWGERRGWQPVHLVRSSIDATTLAAYYRAADVCVVSSLLDGMNLVAKEFVACQRDRLGVLVLSRYAGAAAEMDGAMLVNPYDTAELTRSLRTALAMRPEEREFRLELMRRHLRAHTIHDWTAAIVAEVERLR